MSERESSLDRDVRRSVYRVFGWGDIVMDIPKDMRRISDYSASLGHKTNHAKLNNAEFSFIKHPRFGEIIGIYATKHIKAGMEIFVDYGYIEKYQATQGIIENMLEMMRVTGGWGNKKEFNSDLKRTIGYFRNKVDEMKPLIKAVKMARTFL
ncbi:uncharacterized protein LOC111714001 [Eurytemora carolleeae]|uniref:uncharacterized protein LOC111714001 n=1 Tax=Eurytemora carolleeae TaxID=1294199 RepID=UPI000C7954EF|nr:uncharacterized protein LOC111714001 [Eurytemora carolleeae]|eukprot:XP_023344769.1 uncharacterized protein LOC111714001 [Eurytemora affinis]